MDFFERLAFEREQQNNKQHNDIKLKDDNRNMMFLNEEEDYLNVERNALIVSLDNELKSVKQMKNNGDYYRWQCEMLEGFIKELERVSSSHEFDKVKDSISKYRDEKEKRENVFSFKDESISFDASVGANENSKSDIESYKNSIMKELLIELGIASILSQNDKNFVSISQRFERIIENLKKISTWDELIQFQQLYEDYKKGGIGSGVPKVSSRR